MTTGAAGHLETLQWLVEVKECAWDPEEVFREASENVGTGEVMNYVKSGRALRSPGSMRKGCEWKLPYGDGLPYSW